MFTGVAALCRTLCRRFEAGTRRVQEVSRRERTNVNLLACPGIDFSDLLPAFAVLGGGVVALFTFVVLFALVVAQVASENRAPLD